MSTPRRSLAALAALVPAAVHAQQPPSTSTDSAGRRLEPVVVTAERAGAPLAASSAAVTRLSADALRRLPARTVSEALQFVPGLVVLQGDGLGLAPRIVARGFYGGGETDYLTVLVDGVPAAADLSTGVVNWELVPLPAIESIEVVRGGASSLYGDAAVGGVVNIITRRDQPYARWRVAGGDFGQAQVGGALGGRVGGRQASAFGDLRSTSGYRAHERRDGVSLGGSIDLARDAARALTLSTLNLWRDFDDPGPIAESLVAADRRAAAPFNRFDQTQDELHRLTLDGSAHLAPGRTLTGYVTGEYARADAIRTQPLSAQFADTKDRKTNATRAAGSLQLVTSGVIGGMPNRLVLGTDLAAGRLGARYLKVLSGGESDYAKASGTVGALDTRGTGTRTSAAGFASWELVPADPLRLTLGARADWIGDRFEPRAPSTGDATHVTRAAFSPRAGANLRWLQSARQEGHLYVSAGRSFKAPTMDQLFDQRRTPVPFPPYSISTSNSDLEAQYGTSLEAGAYHSMALVPERWNGRLSASVYQTDMRNELDFDLEQFRYVNLGRSRHRGLETGLTVDGPSGASVFANYTFQHATARNGENAGQLLKAIPRQVLSTGLGRASRTGVSATLAATFVGPTFLDDANTRRLAGHTQLDARASIPVLATRIALDVRNLLGAEFSSTGFPDPGGSPVTFLYPAAGRVVMVGIESRW